MWPPRQKRLCREGTRDVGVRCGVGCWVSSSRRGRRLCAVVGHVVTQLKPELLVELLQWMRPT